MARLSIPRGKKHCCIRRLSDLEALLKKRDPVGLRGCCFPHLPNRERGFNAHDFRNRDIRLQPHGGLGRIIGEDRHIFALLPGAGPEIKLKSHATAIMRRIIGSICGAADASTR